MYIVFKAMAMTWDAYEYAEYDEVFGVGTIHSVHLSEAEARAVQFDNEYGLLAQIVKVEAGGAKLITSWMGDHWETAVEQQERLAREAQEQAEIAERVAANRRRALEREAEEERKREAEAALAAEFEERRKALTKPARVNAQTQRQLEKLEYKQVGWETNGYPDTWPKHKVEAKIAELRSQLSV